MNHSEQDISFSPSRLAMGRLLKNKSAMLGLFFIFLMFLLAVFCYVIVPDKTPDCNSMDLSCSLQPPGTSIDFIRIPVAGYSDVSPLHRFFLGEPAAYRTIAIHSFQVDAQAVRYYEYNGDSNVPGDAGILPLETFGEKMSADEFKSQHIIRRTFWLGTDRFGRDLLSRLIAATRVSLSVGLIAVLISLLIGIGLGALAGYFRGWVDRLILWVINVVWSIPTLLLVVAITLSIGKGFVQVFIAVGLTMWVEVARMVRGQIFSIREQQFVEAGRALGYSSTRIILKHILPNIAGPIIVIAASNFASAILLEAGLSFLGMGAQPPTPSWGMMIKENYAYIVVDAAWLAIFPGAAIALMVLSFTLLGNGLRDAFDTRSL